jgi:hypothetical protein
MHQQINKSTHDSINRRMHQRINEINEINEINACSHVSGGYVVRVRFAEKRVFIRKGHGRSRILREWMMDGIATADTPV